MLLIYNSLIWFKNQEWRYFSTNSAGSGIDLIAGAFWKAQVMLAFLLWLFLWIYWFCSINNSCLPMLNPPKQALQSYMGTDTQTTFTSYTLSLSHTHTELSFELSVSCKYILNHQNNQVISSIISSNFCN